MVMIDAAEGLPLPFASRLIKMLDPNENNPSRSRNAQAPTCNGMPSNLSDDGVGAEDGASAGLSL